VCSAGSESIADPGEGGRSDNFEFPPSLNGGINVVERTVVAWLKKPGYTPKFG
jgi:hypothetical protein